MKNFFSIKISNYFYYSVQILLILLFLTFDLSVELGVAAGIPYVFLVLFSLSSGRKDHILMAASIGSLLIWLGYYLSPPGGESWKILFNRTLSLFLLWATAFLCWSYQKGLERSEQNASRLDNEARVQAILNHSDDGIITTNSMGIIQSFNPAAEKMFGYSCGEALGKNIKIIVPEPWNSEHDQYIKKYLEIGNSRIIGIGREVVGLKKDGRTFPLDLSVSQMELGGEIHFCGITRDLSERKLFEKNLKNLHERNRQILESAGEGIYGVDLNGKTTFVNSSALKMLGYKIEEMLDCPQHKMIHHTKFDGSPYPIEECPIFASFKDGKVHREDNEVFWRKDGTSFPVEYISNPIVENGIIKGAVVTFKDITARKNMEMELHNRKIELEEKNKLLEKLSYHDPLTGIPNRRLFEEVLKREWSRCERVKLPISVIVLDIDFFKQFNDSYGHPAGDRCLKIVANKIQSMLKRPGDIVARIGGEEFAVILPMTETQGAAIVAQRFCDAIRKLKITVKLGASQKNITISLGVASQTPKPGVAQTLVKNADTALYQAKNSGRDRVCIYEEKVLENKPVSTIS